MFETEVKRKVRKEPAVETEVRKDLFPLVGKDGGENEVAAGRDVVSELWTFGV